MKEIEQIFPVNPISLISKERYQGYAGKLKLVDKGLCSAPSNRSSRASRPVPDAPLVKVVGAIGFFEDEEGVLKEGLKFSCKAGQKNVLHVDNDTPVYGKIFYGKFEKIKYTRGNNEDWLQTPGKIVLHAGDQEFNTTNNTSFITGQINHPTEFWLYVDEEPLILKDNKGGFDFVLFFYTEQSYEYLKSKIEEFSSNGQPPAR